ncbi:MAG: amidohydrolase family protein, partial [Thermodesulfobacteriota bacterium]
MEKLLITAETVLPISSNPLSKGAVLIAGGKIRAVGKASQLRKTHKSIHTIDLGQGILLPGFVNGHTHLELGWVGKNLGQFSGFMEWIEQIILAKTEEITRQEIEKAVEHGVRSLVESGVTTVGEISSYGGLDKPILEKSGLRTVLFRELFDRHGDFWNVFSFDKNEIHEERPFPHSPY